MPNLLDDSEWAQKNWEHLKVPPNSQRFFSPVKKQYEEDPIS